MSHKFFFQKLIIFILFFGGCLQTHADLVDCPKCHGRGKHSYKPIPKYGANIDEYDICDKCLQRYNIYSGHTGFCPLCGGTGRVDDGSVTVRVKSQRNYNSSNNGALPPGYTPTPFNPPPYNPNYSTPVYTTPVYVPPSYPPAYNPSVPQQKTSYSNKNSNNSSNKNHSQNKSNKIDNSINNKDNFNYHPNSETNYNSQHNYNKSNKHTNYHKRSSYQERKDRLIYNIFIVFFSLFFYSVIIFIFRKQLKSYIMNKIDYTKQAVAGIDDSKNLKKLFSDFMHYTIRIFSSSVNAILSLALIVFSIIYKIIKWILGLITKKQKLTSEEYNKDNKNLNQKQSSTQQ
jgi:hypothetical protein